MVSTEENSLSELLGAALPKGVLDGLPGFSKISSPDVPAMAFAAKPIEAFSYGLGEPAMAELAEAALAYTPEEANATAVGTKAPANLTLVADNGAEVGGDEAVEMPQDAESVAIRAEASQLLSEIERMDSEVKADLGPEIALLKAALQTGRASGVDFERIRDRITAAATNAEAAKVETAEQKRARLWNEIEQLDKEASDILRPHMSDEEREKEDEYKQKIANARTEEERIAITKEYHDWRRNLQQDWLNGDDPNKQGAARQAEKPITRAEDARKQIDEDFNRILNQTKPEVREQNAASATTSTLLEESFGGSQSEATRHLTAQITETANDLSAFSATPAVISPVMDQAAMPQSEDLAFGAVGVTAASTDAKAASLPTLNGVVLSDPSAPATTLTNFAKNVQATSATIHT